MSRVLLALLFCSSVSATLYGQSDQEAYARADEILARAEQAVSKHYVDFLTANEAPLRTARSELASLIKELNENGKQTTATSLQSRLNKLEETIQKRASAKVPIVAPPQESLLKRIAGKWNRSNSDLYWVIQDNATAGARRKAGDTPAHADSIARVISDEVAEITWPGGLRWRIRQAGTDMLAVEEVDASGKVLQDGLVLTRSK